MSETMSEMPELPGARPATKSSGAILNSAKPVRSGRTPVGRVTEAVDKGVRDDGVLPL